LHDDPILAPLPEDLDLSSTQVYQHIDMAIDRVDPVVELNLVPSAGVDIEVDAVLGSLALRNPLKEETGPFALRVYNRSEIVAILLRDVVGIGKSLPGFETRRRRLEDVVESGGPEPGKCLRVVGIEGDLY
jgi:hypothetical protein